MSSSPLRLLKPMTPLQLKSQRVLNWKLLRALQGIVCRICGVLMSGIMVIKHATSMMYLGPMAMFCGYKTQGRQYTHIGSGDYGFSPLTLFHGPQPSASNFMSTKIASHRHNNISVRPAQAERQYGHSMSCFDYVQGSA